MLKNRRRLAVALTVLYGAIGGTGNAFGQAENQEAKMPAAVDAGAPRSKSSPEGVLESRGLGKVGRYYVVAAEKEVGAGYGKIKPIYNVMESVLNDYQAILRAEYNYQYLDNERILAETYIQDLAIQLGNLTNNAVNRLAIQDLRREQQATRIYLNEVWGNLQIARKNLVAPAKKQAVWDEFLRRRIDFLEANKELSPVVAKVVKEYNELKKDPAVKDALQTLTKRSNAPTLLGPSKDLTSAINKLRRAEEMVSFDPDAYRRKTKKRSKVQKNAQVGG